MRHAAAPILLALALAACSTPAAEEPAPCTGDGCDGGQGGSGGGAGEECPDLAATSPCGFDGPDDACRDEVCALATTTCPNGGRCCTLPQVCAPPVGSRPGGVRCQDDGECASGLCVEVSGVRSCQRTCQRVGAEDSCPDGQHCETLALPGGAVASTCVGGATIDARDPQATVCLRPSHCEEGRDCRIVNPDAVVDGRAFALCLPAAPVDDLFEPCPPPPGTFPPEHGEQQSALCPMGGLCWDGCRGTDSYACYCSQAQIDDGSCRGFRCTAVCGSDADCPDRTQCQSFNNRAVPFSDVRQAFSICRFPVGNPLDTGCWDELDCCKGGLRSNGTSCCEKVNDICVNPLDPAEETHCRLFPSGGRYLTQCALPEGRLPLGAACATDDACVSGLCVDDGAGGRVCSSPCDVRFDRCADVQAGTACCPTVVTSEDGPHCVPACRFGCESPAACEPP